MGPSAILFKIQPVTIDTVQNNIRPNIGDGLNFVTFGQTFKSLESRELKATEVTNKII